MSQTTKTNTNRVEEEEPEYQLGVTDIDISASIAEDEEDVIEFDYEAAAVFKRLADDIYESPEAGLREPLTNSITTTRRAQKDYGVSDPVITITVQKGEQIVLRIRDMGEGITKSVLDNILTVVGRSTARDDGKLSGQYGMGFLASYKLVGMDGGFIMCTNPRGTNEGPYSGLFKPGVFEYDNDNSKIPLLLDENEYGTVFEYVVKPSIGVEDIRQWVEKHSRFSSVPVIYRELDESGEEVYNEDFHSPNLTGTYGSMPAIHIETPYYEATTSPAADNEIVLISSPVNMYGTRALRKNLPWSVDIRLKYENGIVFKGPHEGLIPTSSSQYEQLSEKRKKKYVSEEDLTDDDLTLPESTGTRERLRKHKPFLRHVNGKLREKYLSSVESTLNNFNPSKEAMENLDGLDRHILFKIFSNLEGDSGDDNPEYTSEKLRKKMESDYSYSEITDEMVSFLKTMVKEVKIVSGSKNHKSRYPKKSAYDLAQEEQQVYMCVSTNSWKIDAVNSSPNETEIISVSKASEYEEFEKHLGWKPLKTIKKSNAESILNISEEVLNKVTSKSSTTSADTVSEESVTIHYASGGRNTTKHSAEYIKDMYDEINCDTNTRMGDILVLFPHNYEHNVSDYYHLAKGPCSVSACSSKVADYLVGNSEGIMLYEDYVDWVENIEIKTTRGHVSVDNLIESVGELIVHAKENVKTCFLNNSGVMSKMEEQLKNELDTSSLVTYAIVNPQVWQHVELSYSRKDLNNVEFVRSNHSFNSTKYCNEINEVSLYAKCLFNQDQYKSDEVKKVINARKALSKDIVGILNSIQKAIELNDGKTASMIEEDSENDIRYPVVKTKYGEISLDEVYDIVGSSNVILHPITSDKIETFETDEILNVGSEYISGSRMFDYEIPSLPMESVYVPILESEFRRIKEHIPEETIIVSHSSFSRSRAYALTDGEVYAIIKLHNWDTIPDYLLDNRDFDKSRAMVDTLSELHDEGEELDNIKSSLAAQIMVNKNMSE